jgi:hypothetical protein
VGGLGRPGSAEKNCLAINVASWGERDLDRICPIFARTCFWRTQSRNPVNFV